MSMVDIDAFRDNLLSSFATKLVNEKDEFIFKALGRFGITRDNLTEYNDRLIISRHHDMKSGITYDRYNLDYKPIFTVMSWCEPHLDKPYSFEYKTRIEFFEED